MAKIIPLFIVCSTSCSVSSCLHRAESQKMLEVRANYDGKDRDEASSLSLGSSEVITNGFAVPVRTPPKTAHIWIFPHETPTKEYFWGGWMSVVVEGDRWDVERPADTLPAKPDSVSVIQNATVKK